MASNKTLTRAALALLTSMTLATCARAQQLYQSSSMPVEVERIYVKGLDYLAKAQLPAGNWPDATHGSDPAVVGLAVVSMLAHGDDPNFGPYSTAIKHGLDFVLKQQDAKTGYIGNSMYNHGFSTLALAESYGTVDDPRLGPALQKAIELIVDSQEKNANHAWRYSPQSTDADTTVSGAQMVALFAARNAGVPVPEKAIQNGVKFFISMQTPEGGFGYTSPVGPNGPRAAIGCLVLALAKEKDSPAFKAGFEYLKKARTESQYPEYFGYYASQAFFHGSPQEWQTWNRDNIKTLKTTQSVDGNWDGQFGAVFATSASLLSLALNYRYLPIYER
ncbi:MAG: Squalene--hopene cyclase [Verrucomicrobiales bacterium]|nr:Squalene--hopene cyclase [Verrucomicrobiales bacterium]